ncbi:hypothetical protein P8452_47607 [Trifolium repens]|nr:hypothetical protein P8452_47607 [Trifolium repens]
MDAIHSHLKQPSYSCILILHSLIGDTTATCISACNSKKNKPLSLFSLLLLLHSLSLSLSRSFSLPPSAFIISSYTTQPLSSFTTISIAVSSTTTRTIFFFLSAGLKIINPNPQNRKRKRKKSIQLKTVSKQMINCELDEVLTRELAEDDYSCVSFKLKKSKSL